MVDLNLSKKFNIFIQQHGHKIFYVSINRSLRCHCYREKEKEGSSECKDCFGTGFKADVVSYLTRRSVLSDAPLGTANRLERAGEIHQNSYNYYLQEFVNPKEGDYILEFQCNNKKNIVGLSMVYMISHTASHFFDDSTTVYHKCSTRSQPTSIPHFWRSLVWHINQKNPK